eukprot:364354-Chlamydomonas_euryale.AAC.12
MLYVQQLVESMDLPQWPLVLNKRVECACTELNRSTLAAAVIAGVRCTAPKGLSAAACPLGRAAVPAAPKTANQPLLVMCRS